MNLYTKEELEAKSYDRLLEIAINENLIDVYTENKNKKELIELILKYRLNDYDKRIVMKDDAGFHYVQRIIDEKLEKYYKSLNDIEIPRNIKIYKGINFSKFDNYLIYIDKNIQISEKLVLLVGKNQYVYAILYLEKNSVSEKYKIYKFGDEIIDRFDEMMQEDQQFSLLFFPEYETQILIGVYNKVENNILPTKLNCYSVDINKFEYIIPKNNNDEFCFILENNQIKSGEIKKEFALYVRDISNNNMFIEYFDKAKNSVCNKDYLLNGTYFNDVYDFINLNENICIYDDTLNFLYLKKTVLQDKILEKLEQIVNSCYKKLYNKYYLIGLNINNDRFMYIPIFFIANYELIIKKIKEKVKSYKSSKYLIISSEDIYLTISINDFSLQEKDINYDVRINTLVKYMDDKVSYKSLINTIYIYIKHRITDINYELMSKKTIMKYIDDNKYAEIVNKIEKSYSLTEKIFKTDYKKYTSKTNDEYISIYKNHLVLESICKKIFDNYIENDFEKEYTIKEFNITIHKKEIDDIIFYKIYKVLNDYFKKYNLLELIDCFEGIKLVGSFVKSDVFYNVLKEFIPGKMIQYEDQKENSSYNIEIMNQYINDKKLGIVKLEHNIEYEKKEIKLYALNFKEEYVLVYNNLKNEIGYIDKIDDIKIMNIKIHINDNVIDKILVIGDEFKEKDEKFIDINQKYLNDIDNNILRIFFRYDDSLIVSYIKRQNDQLYFAEEKITV